MKPTKLSTKEKERYLRQIILNQWGEEGQLKIKQKKVFVCGAGGLGSASLLTLAFAGFENIRVCDYQNIELSNLNRQILYQIKDLGEKKAAIAYKRLKQINPNMNIIAMEKRLQRNNREEIIGEVDLIIDGLDNMMTRYLINEYAFERKIPYIYGSIEGWFGMVSFFYPGKTGCLECLFPKKKQSPPKIFPAVVVSPVSIANFQTSEAIKYSLGIEEDLLINTLLTMDMKYNEVRKMDLVPNPQCSVCGKQ